MVLNTDPPDTITTSEPAQPSHSTEGGASMDQTVTAAAAAVADQVGEDDVVDHGVEKGAIALDEASVLIGLTEGVRDQEDIERDITNRVNQAITEKEDERDQARIERIKGNIEKLEVQKQTTKRRLEASSNNTLVRNRCLADLERIGADIKILVKDIEDIDSRIAERHQYDEAEIQDEGSNPNKKMRNESQRDFLIRTGKITPFSRLAERGPESRKGDLTEALMDAEEEAELAEMEIPAATHMSHQNLKLPGFSDIPETVITASESEFGLRPRKKRMLANGAASTIPTPSDEDSFTPDETSGDNTDLRGDDDTDKAPVKSKKRSLAKPQEQEELDLAGIDDGNEEVYQTRLKKWVEKRSAARSHALEQDQQASDNADEEEWFKPCPGVADRQLENGIKMPGDIHPALFDYQKTGVQWLGELYSQQVGGIVGDEMGLGKTIQVIAFVSALHYSKQLTKPVIVVAPATVLRHWSNEFHKWWPALRVSILHSSGSGMAKGRNERHPKATEDGFGQGVKKKSPKAAKKIVDRVVEHGHVLITTYAGLQTYADLLVSVDWGYAVLDEGHKIKNPNTAITIHCKELRTPNRIILSGTPIQNNLIELWSLFDFVFPMRLGTLVNFRTAFDIPITQGGYANATNLQILTAQKCAETLKATISPYHLKRMKVDVAADLPKKTEQVLFCKITRPQREAYEAFLASDDMASIMNRTKQSLYGIDILRKICNHPDLVNPRLKSKPGYKWGAGNKSGKMQVVKALLEMWKGYGHKTLLFTQGVKMLDVLEKFVKNLGGFNYLRMDGTTNIQDRQTLVDRFNNEPDQHVFLLTTKVGGLGVNLTGGNRVIIFDPDWNPSTDMQAQERAWRLGQKKDVVIYRLMSAGTIEEKIYHRQIYKQFLANKVMKDPTQRQTVQMKDLEDLFTLGSREDGSTETGDLFKGTEVQFKKSSEPAIPGDVTQSPEAEVQGDIDAGIRDLVGVAGLEVFQNEAEEKSSSEESSLMQGIFSRSGVQSALEHDQIINGKLKVTADRGMIEREAKRVAAEGAAVLRRAGEAARTVTPGTVTWTGEFGSAGRPANIRRNGPSSAGVLAGLAGNSNTASASSSRSGTPGVATAPRYQRDYVKLIQNYIRAQGGSAASQALQNHFDRFTRGPGQVEQFTEALHKVASTEAGHSRMRNIWTLKDDYK